MASGGRSAEPLRVLAVAESAAALATSDYQMVVDGIVGPWYLGVVVEPLARRGVDTTYVVRRPELEVARVRVRSRQGKEQRDGRLAGAFDDEDPAAHMWRQFSDLGELEDHVIDNTRLDAIETAALVWSRYSDGDDRL